jgi:hypothetical protein
MKKKAIFALAGLSIGVLLAACASFRAAQAVEHYNRGAENYRQDNFELAIEEFTEAIALDPQLTLAYSSRGAAYKAAGDYDRAIADYDQAIALDPQLALAYLNRGNAYSDMGEYDRAITDMEKVLELGSESGLRENAESALDELRRFIAGELNFDGHWGGNTEQGEVFEFTIENGVIVSIGFGFRILGCESLSPVYSGGPDLRNLEGNSFLMESSIRTISGTFTSSRTAVGTVEVDCEDGLSTSWNARRGTRAVRTPTPEDLVKVPNFEISEGLFSRTAGSKNFDEITTIVASSGDFRQHLRRARLHGGRNGRPTAFGI